jgi:hypothetical protein
MDCGAKKSDGDVLKVGDCIWLLENRSLFACKITQVTDELLYDYLWNDSDEKPWAATGYEYRLAANETPALDTLRHEAKKIREGCFKLVKRQQIPEDVVAAASAGGCPWCMRLEDGADDAAPRDAPVPAMPEPGPQMLEGPRRSGRTVRPREDEKVDATAPQRKVKVPEKRQAATSDEEKADAPPPQTKTKAKGCHAAAAAAGTRWTPHQMLEMIMQQQEQIKTLGKQLDTYGDWIERRNGVDTQVAPVHEATKADPKNNKCFHNRYNVQNLRCLGVAGSDAVMQPFRLPMKWLPVVANENSPYPQYACDILDVFHHQGRIKDKSGFTRRTVCTLCYQEYYRGEPVLITRPGAQKYWNCHVCRHFSSGDRDNTSCIQTCSSECANAPRGEQGLAFYNYMKGRLFKYVVHMLKPGYVLEIMNHEVVINAQNIRMDMYLVVRNTVTARIALYIDVESDTGHHKHNVPDEHASTLKRVRMLRDLVASDQSEPHARGVLIRFDPKGPACAMEGVTHHAIPFIILRDWILAFARSHTSFPVVTVLYLFHDRDNTRILNNTHINERDPLGWVGVTSRAPKIPTYAFNARQDSYPRWWYCTVDPYMLKDFMPGTTHYGGVDLGITRVAEADLDDEDVVNRFEPNHQRRSLRAGPAPGLSPGAGPSNAPPRAGPSAHLLSMEARVEWNSEDVFPETAGNRPFPERWSLVIPEACLCETCIVARSRGV